jgi:hypothetical protein
MCSISPHLAQLQRSAEATPLWSLCSELVCNSIEANVLIKFILTYIATVQEAIKKIKKH